MVTHKYQTDQTLIEIDFNSTIVSPVIIHENSVVGAGSVVINDVQEGTTVIGVPAKNKKKE